MKSTVLLFFLVSTMMFGQVKYEPGYLINVDNQRIECLIKHYDWNYNPTDIEYKIGDNEEVKNADILNVKEFGFDEVLKYVRFTAQLDTSAMGLSNLSTTKNPEWKEKTMFLKVILQGKASLYKYEDDKVCRFFYSTNDTTVEQLVYKEYYANNNLTTPASIQNKSYGTNNSFRQQLYVNVNCNNKTHQFEDLDYDQKQLTNYFEEYNKCNGITPYIYKNKAAKTYMSVKVYGGINYVNLTIQSLPGIGEFSNFDTKTSYQIGGEFELILPTNKKNWSFIVGAAKYLYSAKATSGDYDAIIDLNTIVFEFGVRHYFFLKNGGMLYLNGFINRNDNVGTIDIKTNYNVDVTLYTMPVMSTLNMAFGGGFEYKRFSAEIKYNSNQSFLDHEFNSAKYGYTSFVLGYRVFNGQSQKSNRKYSTDRSANGVRKLFFEN